MVDELGYDNVMQVPRIRKVVINIGVGEALDNPVLEYAGRRPAHDHGSQPVITRAQFGCQL